MRFCQTLVGPGRAYHPRRLPATGSQYLECRRGRRSGLYKMYTPAPRVACKFLGILRGEKRRTDEKAGRASRAPLALATYSELKILFWLMKMSTSCGDDDILWAMTTRMHGDVSITTHPGIRGTSWIRPQTPEYRPARSQQACPSAARPF